jgi:hypothetical protein
MEQLQSKSVMKQAEALAVQCGLHQPWIIVSEQYLSDSHKIRTESIIYALSAVTRPCCDHGKTAHSAFIAVKLKRTTVAELKTNGKITRFPASKPLYLQLVWCMECAKNVAAEQGGRLDWLLAR